MTGTFRHTASNVIDVVIAGERFPLGVTDNHPFWSEDRQAYVPAGELLSGERLRRADGELVRVTRVVPRVGVQAVFNLEVDAEHVYFVGADGILVHNQYHHIVSIYPNLARPAAARAIRQSQGILQKANIGRWTGGAGGNLRWVPSHLPKQHSIAYHQAVAAELSRAVRGLRPGAQYTSTVEQTLDNLLALINSGHLPLY